MKIKKYAPYILILVMLVGLFSFTRVTGAVSSVSQVSGSDSGADVCSALAGVSKIICQTKQILNSIIPVLVSLGVVYFVWGVVQYVIGNDEEAKKKGKNRVIYGIIGLAVIVGLWGLVNIVVNALGIGGQTVSVTDLSKPINDANAGPGCQLGTNPKFQHLIIYITCIISNAVIPLIFALALAMFVWGVVQFVINSSEESKKEKGREFMIWGIIALAVMVSVWGLVHILGATFNIDYAIPQVKP